jgi:MFS family permease
MSLTNCSSDSAIKAMSTNMSQITTHRNYAYYVVVVLLLVYILAYFDRYILTLLIDPIKESMGLSDFQIGLLLGPAFSIFYVAAGIPLGWLADRSNRKWLLIGGIVLWCTMTTGSAFATTFVALFVLRFGLGIGEAVVTPLSISLISDYFSREDRGRAVSLYMAGPYLGAGLAFIIGGNLVGSLEGGVGIAGVGLGHFETWQLAFLIVGLPGFLIAMLMLTVREPKRTEQIAQAGSTAAAVRYMLQNWRAFGPLLVGSTCNFALATLTFWNVALFQRAWGWDVATVGTVTGIFYFTAGPMGTALAVWLLNRFGTRHADAPMRLLLIGLLIAIPASALYPIMPSAYAAIAFMFIAFIGKSVATAGGPAALSLINPGDNRSQTVAMYNTVIALVGPVIGPPLIGYATDQLGDPGALGMVLCAFVVAIGIPSILIVAFGRGSFAETRAKLEAAL